MTCVVVVVVTISELVVVSELLSLSWAVLLVVFKCTIGSHLICNN